MYLILPDDAKIIFDGKDYTNAEIEKFYLSHRKGDATELSFLGMLERCLPIIINSNPNSEPLILKASMKRFDHTVNGEKSESFCGLGIRFIPIQGQIDSVQLQNHHDHRVAIDYFIATPDFISADFGNGRLHFELSFDECEFEEEIGPPNGFK